MENKPVAARGPKKKPAMSDKQVKAMLEASGLSGAEMARRLKCVPNTMTKYTNNGVDHATALAMAAAVVGLPKWEDDNAAAFEALRGMIPVLFSPPLKK